jgi:hypothetical protein
VLSKYEMLYPSKSLSVIIKWKEVLEKIHVLLGKMEQQINDDLEAQQVIFDAFDIKSAQSKQITSNYKITKDFKNKYNNMKFGLIFKHHSIYKKF